MSAAESVRPYQELPSMGNFYRGLRQAGPRQNNIPPRWEGYRAKLMPILCCHVATREVVICDRGKFQIKSGIEGTEVHKAFEMRRDFETALWELEKAANIVDLSDKRPAEDEVLYVKIEKDGPAVKLTRGQDQSAPTFIITSEDPYTGASLDVAMLRLSNWEQVEKWQEGVETRALDSMTRLVGANPAFIFFQDPSQPTKESTLSSYGAVWSTKPTERLAQMKMRFQTGEIPIRDTFWTTLANDSLAINVFNQLVHVALVNVDLQL